MGGGERLSGRCLCGDVRFTAVPKKNEMDVCHCSMCRRWTGGVLMTVPCRDVEIESEAALGVYRASEWAERVFCRTCGSSLFWRMQDGKGHTAVSMNGFEDVSRFVFAEEIFVDEQPATYRFAGERRRLTGAEVMAEFAAQQEG